MACINKASAYARACRQEHTNTRIKIWRRANCVKRGVKLIFSPFSCHVETTAVTSSLEMIQDRNLCSVGTGSKWWRSGWTEDTLRCLFLWCYHQRWVNSQSSEGHEPWLHRYHLRRDLLYLTMWCRKTHKAECDKRYLYFWPAVIQNRPK